MAVMDAPVRTVPTPEEVTEFVAGMGSSSDEVCGWMRKHGIRGVAGEPNVCAIAKALKGRWPDVTFEVGMASIWFWPNQTVVKGVMPDAAKYVDNTPAGRDFVEDFDNQKYIDLIIPDEDRQ